MNLPPAISFSKNMELYVIRHGTTIWNKEKRLQGRADIPLDEDGEALAVECGKGMADIHFDICYTSPLKRAYRTAELILEGRSVPIIPDERLTEVSFGEREGKEAAGVNRARKVSAGYVGPHGITDFIPPKTGESLESLLERTKDFYDEITGNPDNEDKRILVSMHGASGRALMYNAWGGNSFWHGGVPKNCTVCIVRLKNGQVTEIEQDVTFYETEVEAFY